MRRDDISESRAGAGRFRIALDRASDTDRTAEIRRQASRIPQRCAVRSKGLAASAAFTSLQSAGSSSSCADCSGPELGEVARYSGLPTRNMICWGGVALRTSSQNRSRGAVFSALMSTRSYRSARHQQRASVMSAAQSTSTPSFRMVSERRSRLVRDVSTRSTRFFFEGAAVGFNTDQFRVGALMRSPLSVSIWLPTLLRNLADSN
jgi:hypothetical protein